MNIVSLLFHDVYAASPRESGFPSEAADRYKLSIAEFDAQLDGLTHAGVETLLLASTFDGSKSSTVESRLPASGSRGPRPEARIPTAITFDDGGESYYTAAADRLEALGWRGHCFVSTDFINRRGFLSAEQIRELDARGHLIGSHSASHPSRFSSLSMARMRSEWLESRRALEDLLGRRVTAGSVPGGYFSRAVAAAAAEAGLRVLFTSEPTKAMWRVGECTVIGRFTIRRGHAPDMARRFAHGPSWTRCGAWIGWNAKGAVKPLLGPSYARIAEWLLAPRVTTRHE